MTDELKNQASMLISFYNMEARSGFRKNNEKNLEFAARLITACDGDLYKAKNLVRTYVANNADKANTDFGFQLCFMQEVKKETPVDAKLVAERSVEDSLSVLEQALVSVVADRSIHKIESEIMDGVKAIIQNFIKSEYGTIERKVITVIDGEKKDIPGAVHEKFDEVLKFVANDEPVYLVGPAGSGKNYICKQVADALGLKFYFTNAVTQEYKLTGFTDANGHYQETQFYKAFRFGGLFMLDEMDASIPDVLVILNAAIANRYFDFPAPIGYVEAHPNFRVVAAGNTFGMGANMDYVGRSQLDVASLDRFAPIEIDYCKTVENALSDDPELVDFCRDFRNVAKNNGVRCVVSYRAINRLSKMVKLMSMEEALKTCLVKGLEKDDIRLICNNLKDSKFKTALKKLY